MDQHIQEILNSFDFAKVQRVMLLLNWRWFNTERGVPSEHELRHAALDLLTAASAFEPGHYVGTGGFYASMRQSSKGPYLELEFTLEHSDSEWVALGLVEGK